MKFLFAGCGSIGRRHIRNLKSLLPLAEILAYRVRKDDLGDFEKEFQIRRFDDYEKALDQKPDAVFITNPTVFHVPYARMAADRKCHLFIEKPLSHTLEDVDSMIDICQKNEVIAYVAYNLRFHPSIRKIKQMLDAGSIGSLISGRARYGGYLPAWHPWENYQRMYSSQRAMGGGVVLDASHEIDYLTWMMGDVVEIKSFCGKLSDLEIDTEDTAEMILRFKSGAFGSIHLNYLQHPEYRSCEFVGTEGTILWNQHREAVEVYRVAEKKWNTYPLPKNFQANDMYIEEMRHFLACLAGEEQPLCGLLDARKIVKIAMEVKEPMMLPEIKS